MASNCFTGFSTKMWRSGHMFFYVPSIHCVFTKWNIELEAKSVCSPAFHLTERLSFILPGFQEIHLTLYIQFCMLYQRGEILDAGFKMRVRHPNYCETSSQPVSAPNFMLSATKRNKWRLMMLWFGK